MVNLLFITNSTKIDRIKNTLQPFLKVKIDIVEDFDFGLKDVFEKRPATVFIQDQIAGVTGESVARHIQMLLGSGSPSFIFMHNGTTKAKPIKGLFDHLIDLSQDELKIVADILATLKILLGSHWEKIYVHPEKVVEVAADTALKSDSTNRSSDADQLVDELFADLGNTSDQVAKLSNPVSIIDAPFDVVSSPQDQLAEMLVESKKNEQHNSSAQSTIGDDTLSNTVSDDTVNLGLIQSIHKPVPANNIVPAVAPVSPPVFSQPRVIPSSRIQAVTSPLSTLKNGNEASEPVIEPEAPLTQQILPPDFVIVKEWQSGDVAPEDLLREFEGNYYSHVKDWKRYAIVAFVLSGCVFTGIWYFFKNGAPYTSASNQTTQPAAVSTNRNAGVVPPPLKQETLPVHKVELSELPSFISQSGLDKSYSLSKPGWERYVDNVSEYRVFRNSGKIKALQVMGLNNHDISETRMKSILIELLGDGEYKVNSHEQKQGYQVSSAIVAKNADLLIYFKKSSIRAFVVSLN
jgi:flagellar FliL protein